MAQLLKTDGTKIEIQPNNGTDFQLNELQGYVDGLIEIVNLQNGQILVVNEDGKDRYETNKTATEIAHQHNAIFDDDWIDGDVILCNDEEVL